MFRSACVNSQACVYALFWPYCMYTYFIRHVILWRHGLSISRTHRITACYTELHENGTIHGLYTSVVGWIPWILNGTATPEHVMVNGRVSVLWEMRTVISVKRMRARKLLLNYCVSTLAHKCRVVWKCGKVTRSLSRRSFGSCMLNCTAVENIFMSQKTPNLHVETIPPLSIAQFHDSTEATRTFKRENEPRYGRSCDWKY